MISLKPLRALLTRKKFTHRLGKYTYLVTAEPEDFFAEAKKNGYDVFQMRCFHMYTQMANGTWKKTGVISFRNENELKTSGVVKL